MKFCNLSSVSCPHIRPSVSSPAISAFAGIIWESHAHLYRGVLYPLMHSKAEEAVGDRENVTTRVRFTPLSVALKADASRLVSRKRRTNDPKSIRIASSTRSVAARNWTFPQKSNPPLRFCLFCSLAVLDPRVGHTMDVLSPFSPSSVILIDSSTESPVHVLMSSIQAVRGLPSLPAPGTVPCIISFSRQLPNCILMV